MPEGVSKAYEEKHGGAIDKMMIKHKLNIERGDDEKQLSSKALKFCSLTSLSEKSNQHDLLQK